MSIVDREGRLWHRWSLIDVAIVGVVLALMPLFYYGYRSVVEHGHLQIDRVEPSVITSGMQTHLTILGRGFDEKTKVQLGELSFEPAQFVNPVHLKVAVPPNIGPGPHRIQIRNSRGRLVIRDNVLHVIWQPWVKEVKPSTLTAGREEPLTITGRYFEHNCTVAMGARRLERRVEYVGPTELRVTPASQELAPGTHGITVTNPNGHAGTLAGAVQVVLPPPRPPAPVRINAPAPVAPKLTPPPLQVSAPLPSRTEVVLVTCAFPKPKPSQRRLLARGAEGWDDDRVVIAKILDILGDGPGVAGLVATGSRTRVTRDTDSGFILASLLLACTAVETPDGPRYFFNEKPLQVGSQAPLRFHPMVTKATLLTDPTPVPNGWELLHHHEQ